MFLIKIYNTCKVKHVENKIHSRCIHVWCKGVMWVHSGDIQYESKYNDQRHKSHFSLHWHHNEGDGISNRQHHECLINHLFRRKSKKTSKLRVTGLCEENSPVTGEFPPQRASNAENVSIWWCHVTLMALFTWDLVLQPLQNCGCMQWISHDTRIQIQTGNTNDKLSRINIQILSKCLANRGDKSQWIR